MVNKNNTKETWKILHNVMENNEKTRNILNYLLNEQNNEINVKEWQMNLTLFFL